ncbi:MAG: histone [Candidatus Micrarchaeia archaeon]
MYISSSSVRKALKDAGCGRVSKDAISLLQDYMDNQIYGIAKKSVLLAKHAKRKTVIRSDVKLAIK